MGVPPHAFTSAKRRAIDNAVSIPAGWGPMPRKAIRRDGPLRPAAIRRNAKKRLPPYPFGLWALRSALRAFSI